VAWHVLIDSPVDSERLPRGYLDAHVDVPVRPYYGAMSSTPPTVQAPFVLDHEDRVTILQLLTLSPTERVQYLLDELAFDESVSDARQDG
jgi:hypothetical protein